MKRFKTTETARRWARRHALNREICAITLSGPVTVRSYRHAGPDGTASCTYVETIGEQLPLPYTGSISIWR